MTKVRIQGQNCATVQCVRDSQAPIQFQDEGIDLGLEGTVRVINFVGAAVTAVRSGSVLTITITGGSEGTSPILEYTDFETDGLPAGVDEGYTRIIRTVDPDYQQTINGVQYYNNKIIHWNGTRWVSWSGDYATS